MHSPVIVGMFLIWSVPFFLYLIKPMRFDFVLLKRYGIVFIVSGIGALCACVIAYSCISVFKLGENGNIAANPQKILKLVLAFTGVDLIA